MKNVSACSSWVFVGAIAVYSPGHPEGYLVAGEGDRGNGFALARGVFLREGFARFAFGGSVAHVPQRLRAGAWSGASESRDRRETRR
jgi:hypothetical protein